MTTDISSTSSQVDNPFKEARLAIVDPDTGRAISHDRLARRIGVSKLTLIRTEQAIFLDPPPTVLQYFLDNGFNYLALTDGYLEFQHATRRQHLKYFGATLIFDLASGVHPLCQLRNRVVLDHNGQPCKKIHYSVMQVSKDLCIPQSTLSRWENDVRSQQTVPKALINVLPVLDYSDADISQFMADYCDWRARYLGKNVLPMDSVMDLTSFSNEFKGAVGEEDING